MTTCRLGILLSGRGSNFEAIAEAIADNLLPNAQIAVVLSNKPEAPGLASARAKNIPAVVVSDDADILKTLQTHRVDLVILAGYNRILSETLVRAYVSRILNIHPSLLPAYGGKGMIGLKVHQAVIAAKEAQSGCTVHLVTSDVDAGPVLGQARVAVDPADTPETLAQKVLREEHRLYPAVIRQYIDEALSRPQKVIHHEPNSIHSDHAPI